MSLALRMTSCYVFKDAKLLTDSMTVFLGFASKESRAPQERAEERVSRAGPGRKLRRRVRLRAGRHAVLATAADTSGFRSERRLFGRRSSLSPRKPQEAHSGWKASVAQT